MNAWIKSLGATFLVAAASFSVPTAADAQASKGTESNACQGCSRSGGGGSSGQNNAAAAIGLGLGLLLQGLANAPTDNSDYEERKRSKFDAERRERATAAQRKGKLSKLQNQAAADKSLNPWTDKPVEKKTASQSGRAPYADNSCVDIKVAGSGITWDSTKLINKCSFPIQVLTCYYDKGERQKCDSFKQRFWGTSSTIAPSGSTGSVSSSKRPGFGVRYFVCDMSGVKNHSKLCLLPKA